MTVVLFNSQNKKNFIKFNDDDDDDDNININIIIRIIRLINLLILIK